MVVLSFVVIPYQCGEKYTFKQLLKQIDSVRMFLFHFYAAFIVFVLFQAAEKQLSYTR